MVKTEFNLYGFDLIDFMKVFREKMEFDRGGSLKKGKGEEKGSAKEGENDWMLLLIVS